MFLYDAEALQSQLLSPRRGREANHDVDDFANSSPALINPIIMTLLQDLLHAASQLVQVAVRDHQPPSLFFLPTSPAIKTGSCSTSSVLILRLSRSSPRTLGTRENVTCMHSLLAKRETPAFGVRASFLSFFLGYRERRLHMDTLLLTKVTRCSSPVCLPVRTCTWLYLYVYTYMDIYKRVLSSAYMYICGYSARLCISP